MPFSWIEEANEEGYILSNNRVIENAELEIV
jgi:hypothetical protein